MEVRLQIAESINHPAAVGVPFHDAESLAPHEDIRNLKSDLEKLGERIDKLDDRMAGLAVVVRAQTWMLGLVVLVVFLPQLVAWFST